MLLLHGRHRRGRCRCGRDNRSGNIFLSGGWALVALFALLLGSRDGTATSVQQQQEQRHLRHYVRSDDMGISRCTLQGNIKDEDVVLHIWLRMIPPPLSGSTALRGQTRSKQQDGQDDSSGNNSTGQFALVKGFAHLQSMRNFLPKEKASPQLLQASSISSFSGDIYLRSPYTKHNYALQVTLRGLHPREAIAQLGPATLTHVMDVWGALQLLPQDLKALDFELRATGFAWHCPFLIEPAFDTTSHSPQQHGGVAAALAAILAANASAATAAGDGGGSNSTAKEGGASATLEQAGGTPGGGNADHGSGAPLPHRGGRHTWLEASLGAGSGEGQQPRKASPRLVMGQWQASGRRHPHTDLWEHPRGLWHRHRAPLDAGRRAAGVTVEAGEKRRLQTSVHSMEGAAEAMLGGEGMAARALAAQQQSLWLNKHMPWPDMAAPAPAVSKASQAAALLQGSGALAAHRPALAAPATEREVWVVLAPYYRVQLLKYATLLWHHVLWHEQLGVQRYLLYTNELLGGLLQQPLIEALVAAGVLTVVHYGEMSKHESMLYYASHTDNYLMQVLVHNHALLALWGSNALALSVDIDEFLVTPKPMSALEVYTQCAGTRAHAVEVDGPVAARPKQQPRGRRALLQQQQGQQQQQHLMQHPGPQRAAQPAVLALQAGLQISRRDAACRPDAPDTLCAPKSCYKFTFYNSSPVAVSLGYTPHPMTWLTMNTDVQQLKAYQDTKAFVDPSAVLDAHVHVFGALPGATQLPADPACVRLVHLKDLFRWRPKKAHLDLMGIEATDQWWWPARAIWQGSARGAKAGTSQGAEQDAGSGRRAPDA